MTLSKFIPKGLILVPWEESDPNVADIFIYSHLAKVLGFGHLFVSQICTEFRVPGANLINSSIAVPCNNVGFLLALVF